MQAVSGYPDYAKCISNVLGTYRAVIDNGSSRYVEDAMATVDYLKSAFQFQVDSIYFFSDSVTPKRYTATRPVVVFSSSLDKLKDARPGEKVLAVFLKSEKWIVNSDFVDAVGQLYNSRPDTWFVFRLSAPELSLDTYNSFLYFFSQINTNVPVTFDDLVSKVTCNLDTSVKLINEFQELHYKQLETVMSKIGIAIDVSFMGTGKTYTGLKLAQSYDFFIVVCPAGVVSKWKQLTRFFNLRHYIVVSYSGKRMVTIGVLDDTLKDLAPSLKKRISGKRVLVVLDEFQKIKNTDTVIFGTVTSLFDNVRKAARVSNYLLISTTPYDLDEYINSFYDLFKVTNVLDFCRRVQEAFPDTQQFKYIAQHSGIDLDLAYKETKSSVDLFKNVVQPRIVLKMFSSFQVTSTVRNLTIDCSVLDGRMTSVIRSASSQSQREYVKCAFIVSRAKEILSQPGKKVLIGMFYKSSIDLVSKELDCPKVVGSTGSRERQRIFSEFNEPSAKSRVIVTNVIVASTGIDLDDKHGDFPRHVIVSPSGFTIDLIQFYARILRQDTKSFGTIENMFFECSKGDQDLLGRLKAKSETIKGMFSQPNQFDYSSVPTDVQLFQDFETVKAQVFPDESTLREQSYL